jgi:hypothetical protein
MPEVVVGWCARCWARWGGIGGGKFYIGEGMTYYTPIWDVLAPEGEQEAALNRLRTRSRSLAFLIRQAVPVGLPQAHFYCWARWARFLMVKNLYYGRYSVFTYNLPIYECLDRREWVDGVGWVWMTLSKLGRCSCLGLPGLGFPLGLVGGRFFYSRYSEYISIKPFSDLQLSFTCLCFMGGVPHTHHTLINKYVYCLQGGVVPPWTVCN